VKSHSGSCKYDDDTCAVGNRLIPQAAVQRNVGENRASDSRMFWTQGSCGPLHDINTLLGTSRILFAPTTECEKRDVVTPVKAITQRPPPWLSRDRQ